jgi:hypothetical protein
VLTARLKSCPPQELWHPASRAPRSHFSIRRSIRPSGFLELAELIDLHLALGEHGLNLQLAGCPISRVLCEKWDRAGGPFKPFFGLSGAFAHHNGVYWCYYGDGKTSSYQINPCKARPAKRNLASQDRQTGRDLGAAARSQRQSRAGGTHRAGDRSPTGKRESVLPTSGTLPRCQRPRAGQAVGGPVGTLRVW